MDEPSLLKQILSEHPKDLELLKNEGIVTAEFGNLSQPDSPAEFGESLYDIAVLKQEILDDLEKFNLLDIEVGQKQYRMVLDSLGTLPQAAKVLGLENMEILEMPDSTFKLGEHSSKSLMELPLFPETVAQYSEKLAQDLNEKLQLPGMVHFGMDSTNPTGNFNLYYSFTDQELPALKEIGVHFKDSPINPQVLDVFPNVPPDQAVRSTPTEVHTAPSIDPILVPTPTPQPTLEPAISSFDEILAALEEEGCHEMAKKLHAILREKD